MQQIDARNAIHCLAETIIQDARNLLSRDFEPKDFDREHSIFERFFYLVALNDLNALEKYEVAPGLVERIAEVARAELQDSGPRFEDRMPLRKVIESEREVSSGRFLPRGVCIHSASDDDTPRIAAAGVEACIFNTLISEWRRKGLLRPFTHSR